MIMLNVSLYNALVRAFKTVKVANPDEVAVFTAPRATPVQNGLKRRHNKNEDPRAYMPNSIVSGEQYKVCCPFCGDKRYRLYISYTWDRTMKDSNGKLIYAGKRAICHNENCLKDGDNFKALNMTIDRYLIRTDSSPLECSSEESVVSRKITLPCIYSLAGPGVPTNISDYLLKRGLDPAELTQTWYAGFGKIWFYPDNVLVFPIYQNNVLKSWQARYAGEDYAKLKKPKYFWPAGTKKSWLLYNLDRAKLHPVVVVTEGIIDCIKVGAPGVALFGKEPSVRQESLLGANWRNGALVWIPDADDPQSLQKAQEYTAKWTAAGVFAKGCHIVKLREGDPGSYDRRTLWNMIKMQVPSLSDFADRFIQ